MIKVRLKVKFDARALKSKYKKATTKGLEMAMFGWETEAKKITTVDMHVVTGRYRASINNNRSDGLAHPTVAESQSGDGIHEKFAYNRFDGGSNVEYASSLEKRFQIMTRALDNSRGHMLQLFSETVAKYI